MSKSLDFQLAIRGYQDSLLFVGGHPVPQGTGRMSDNSGMFTSEYLRIAMDLGSPYIPSNNMPELLDVHGILHRYPDDSNPDLSPDNYLGFLHYCTMAGNPGRELAERLYRFGKANWGAYSVPWSKEGFIWRQPQLLCAALAASDRLSMWKFWQWPLVLYTALVIAVAGMRADPIGDQDTRRLSWHLLHVMSKSRLCRFAAKIWWKRLKKQYGIEGMSLVFARYFSHTHPFARFCINDWEKS